jgi:hypothetical protein
VGGEVVRKTGIVCGSGVTSGACAPLPHTAGVSATGTSVVLQPWSLQYAECLGQDLIGSSAGVGITVLPLPATAPQLLLVMLKGQLKRFGEVDPAVPGVNIEAVLAEVIAAFFD